MAFGIKFVPITPGGGCLRSESAPLTELPENSMFNLKHTNLEAYKRELIALRERDMAITSPTTPEYYARPRRPTVQIASPSEWSGGNDFDFDLGFLEQSLPDYQQYLFVSPTDADLDACYYSEDARTAQLNELVQTIYPNGLPSDFDSWDVYRERPEPSAASSAEGAEDAMCVDDELIWKMLEEIDRKFGPPDVSMTDEEEVEHALTASAPSSPSPDT